MKLSSLLVSILVVSIVLFVPVFAKDEQGGDSASIKSTETYKRISAAIDNIRIIDGHEHMPPEKELTANPPDFFDVFTSFYLASEIKNLGNNFEHDNTKFFDKKLSTEERWQSFLPIYTRLKNTGYARAGRIGIKKVHGIEVTDAESIKKINESMKKLYSKPGVYKEVLYEKGKIDCILDQYGTFKIGEEFPEFKSLWIFDTMVLFVSAKEINVVAKKYGRNIHDLEDLEFVYRKYVDEGVADGVVGFKLVTAYHRPLDFTDYSRDKAEQQLKKILRFSKFVSAPGEAVTLEDCRDLTNYCVHLMLKIIEEKNMPVAIHTGLLTDGDLDVRRSNPQQLTPIFKEYKNINFEIYHGGWPYVTEFTELGKSWSNVFLNQCWLHIISPEAARTQLSEMIETVPVNKIFAFGGDHRYPEQVIGALEITKENCAIVLTEKVLNGYFTENEAIEYAERILRTNLIEFYKLKVSKKGLEKLSSVFISNKNPSVKD